MLVGDLSNESLGVYDNGVLINKLNITDKEKLEIIERNVVARKTAHLYFEPIKGTLDIKHILGIHKFLFESLYPFAGKLREVDSSKPGILFCRPMYIEAYLKDTLKNMKKDILNCKTRDDFVERISYYYSEINIIHPFREGNGRTIREFIREYINFVSQYLPFELNEIDYSKMDKQSFLLATINAAMGNYEELNHTFDKAIVPIYQNQKKL